MLLNPKKIYKVIFPLIITLASCSSHNLQSNVEGQWAITEITYNGKSYKDQLYTNVLIFSETNEISIPETFHFKKDRNANWTTIENEDNIVINTSTIVFNDTFNVEFINRTEHEPLGIILKSETIYIKAYKLLDFQH